MDFEIYTKEAIYELQDVNEVGKVWIPGAFAKVWSLPPILSTTIPKVSSLDSISSRTFVKNWSFKPLQCRTFVKTFVNISCAKPIRGRAFVTIRNNNSLRSRAFVKTWNLKPIWSRTFAKLGVSNLYVARYFSILADRGLYEVGHLQILICTVKPIRSKAVVKIWKLKHIRSRESVKIKV